MALTRTMPMSEAEFRQFSLGDPQGRWELVDGQLPERPGTSAEHGDVMMVFAAQLFNQLDPAEYRVRVQHARLRVSPSTYFIPDVAVIPTALYLALLARPGSLDAYPDPLPLVAGIWSPSTGGYDMDEKLPGYQHRGDCEIWYLHPYDRTLTVWRRQPNGSYAREIYQGGLLPHGIAPSRGHRPRSSALRPAKTATVGHGSCDNLQCPSADWAVRDRQKCACHSPRGIDAKHSLTLSRVSRSPPSDFARPRSLPPGRAGDAATLMARVG